MHSSLISLRIKLWSILTFTVIHVTDTFITSEWMGKNNIDLKENSTFFLNGLILQHPKS